MNQQRGFYTCRAEFILENIEIYLNFLSPINQIKAYVVEIRRYEKCGIFYALLLKLAFLVLSVASLRARYRWLQ